MLFSVIIPTCNRIDLLNKCIDLLHYDIQGLKNDCYEIIVTDDSKTNGTKNLIGEKYPWIHWIQGPKKGPAANRNNGVRYAKGEWLIFIDDDCLPDNKLLFEYKNAIKTFPEASAFEGAIVPDDWKLLKKDMAECPININGGCFWSANICIKADAFNSVKGFDESLEIAAQEDQLIYFQLKKITTVPFVKTAFVIHPVRKVSLIKKIKSINKHLHNWFEYSQKINESPVTAFKSGFKSQIVAFMKTLFSLKIGNSLIHIYTIFIALPVFIIKYYNNK